MTSWTGGRGSKWHRVANKDISRDELEAGLERARGSMREEAAGEIQTGGCIYGFKHCVTVAPNHYMP